MAASNSQKFPYSFADVFAAIEQTLQKNGYTIKMADQDIGRFEVRSGASLFSWGETLWITVEDIDGTSVLVSVTSSLTVAESRVRVTSAEGRNAKHISTIITGVSTYLREHSSPVKPVSQTRSAPTPPPPPTEPANLYLHLSEKVQGPFTAAQVEGFIQVGTASLDTLCCVSGTNEWVPLSSFSS